MANWCSNTVEFIGEHSQFEHLKVFFTAMAAKEKKEGKGQLPAFGNCEGGWLFETRWEEGILYYETKWSPNTEVIITIAEHFKVGFIHSYCEPGNCVYGEATYKEGTLTDVSLDWSDTDHYQYNEESELYEFEGQDYESSDEICELLLDRKKKALAVIAAIQNPGNPQ
jgi:hypothetical protein